MGRSGAGGFVPPPKKPTVSMDLPPEPTEGAKHPKVAPPKDDKPAMGGRSPASKGGGATSVRPKV